MLCVSPLRYLYLEWIAAIWPAWINEKLVAMATPHLTAVAPDNVPAGGSLDNAMGRPLRHARMRQHHNTEQSQGEKLHVGPPETSACSLMPPRGTAPPPVEPKTHIAAVVILAATMIVENPLTNWPTNWRRRAPRFEAGQQKQKRLGACALGRARLFVRPNPRQAPCGSGISGQS